jgi:hypothetical protein
MIESRLASPAPTFGTQYGAPGPQLYGNSAPGHEHPIPNPYEQYSAFGPGQVMNHNSPHSSTLMYQNASYAQSPFSPMASPVSGLGPNDLGHNGGDYGPVLTRQPSAGTQLTRQGSTSSQDHQSYNTTPGPAPYEVNYPAPVAVASRQTGGPDPSSHYVDLNRASVTPFQAAQYVEISKKLNTEVPIGTSTPADTTNNKERRNTPPVPAKDGPSPFADPIPASLRPAGAARESLSGQDVDRPVSGYSTVSVTHDFDFPEPPSPALTVASRFRVDSNPPTLPEISLQSPSVRSSLGSEFTTSAKGLGLRSPATPSPLATSFVNHSPSADRNSLPATPAAVAASVAAGSAVSTKESKRPDTLYNPEDAYGGI